MRAMLLSLLIWGGALSPAFAHEFWIEPFEYQVQSDQPLRAHLRNGEHFAGSAQAYFDNRTQRLEVIRDGATKVLSPRLGDLPAIDQERPANGLNILIYESTPSQLTYTDWDKFQKFAAEKDFDNIGQRHDARGLPRTGFGERYTRHSKSLVAVGSGQGADQETGMRTEFVALANPYTDTFEDGLPVRLLWAGKRRGDAQIEIYAQAPDGTVTTSQIRTNSDGEALIPVIPGHRYLLNAVVLNPLYDQPDVWETLWAALTFAVPAP